MHQRQQKGNAETIPKGTVTTVPRQQGRGMQCERGTLSATDKQQRLGIGYSLFYDTGNTIVSNFAFSVEVCSAEGAAHGHGTVERLSSHGTLACVVVSR